jgi:hypothetical protein
MPQSAFPLDEDAVVWSYVSLADLYVPGTPLNLISWLISLC